MFAIKRISRDKLKWVYQISTSTSLNSDNSNSRGKKEETDNRNPKKGDDENKSKRNDKKLFTEPIRTEKEKNLAKAKLRDLLLESKTINNVPKETKPVKVTQSGRAKKHGARKLPETFEKTLKKSVSKVASELGGNVDETKSDLMNTLMEQKIIGEPEPKAEDAPSAIKTKKKSSVSKAASEKLSSILSEIDNIEIRKTGYKEASSSFKFKRFDFQRKEDEEVKLKIWDELEERELKLLVKHPPRNYFEELILWTEQGKLWHFPIDNDQGREDEAQVDFTEHVFLDEYLEPWCPPAGPLRHFMDLVLVGLSKNPYLTVEDKKEHIFWYRDYFENKKKLLMELGAFTSGKDAKELPEGKQEV